MMDDGLFSDYTDEQVAEMNRQKELDDLRDELTNVHAAELAELCRFNKHLRHTEWHLKRKTFANELRSLLDENSEFHSESVQSKVEALLQKYDVPTFPVIFVNGEYHSEHTDEIEMELAMIPADYAVYHLTAEVKANVQKHKLSEWDL